MDETIEGWFTDPFERHEARWMSQGNPTSLVRDGTVEGSDPVADGPIRAIPPRIETDISAGVSVRRADDADRESPYDPETLSPAASDAFDQGAN